MIYFAYGSNMHPERLRRRVPSREVLTVARLAGWRMTFGKRGRDGSGKCAVLPASPRDVVHGVLYRICPSERPVLDEAEDTHGGGYYAIDVEVAGPTERFTAFTYRPPTNRVDATLQPFDWYKAFVVAGARHHALPVHYLSTLERVMAQPDPDAERDALNRSILRDL